MTIQEALAFGRQQLIHSPDPGLDARLLLECVLEKTHAFLISHRDDRLTAVQENRYLRLIQRAAHQEPIPYLTGDAHFFGRSFYVSPAVLIPRPETEQLVECALAWAKNRRRLRVVDVGAGSGCIAITLALALPEAQIEAVDVSETALGVAAQNSKRHGVLSRIHFYPGNLLEPIDGRPDLIIANLPYITDAEWFDLSDGVKLYEPESALKGGPLGLDLIGQLLYQSKAVLSPGGAIFLEIGWKQGQAVVELAQSIYPTAQVDLMTDYSGNDRIVSVIDQNEPEWKQ